ncbi:DNA sulfur modification protein DndB [Streptomyces sp. NPDC059917]|uniref:DNA sulfur modification protein DndB n=1 Tax=Streptomyces sp. NPDC059917 TaxID=3347002 RepID=UPI003646504F
MLEPIRTGLPVTVMEVRPKLAIGVLDWESALAIVHDPQLVELSASGRVDLGLGEYGQLRSQVQRLIGGAGTSKAKNITSYAEYIARGIRGDLGDGWSVPPLTWWCPRPLSIGRGGKTFLPLRDLIIAVDAETQVSAMHRVRKNHREFGLEGFDFSQVNVAFEIFHGVSTSHARQIFHDRNLKGVPVDKSLALSMDSRDLATSVTRALVDDTVVTLRGEKIRLADYVLTGKRQIGSTAREWVTLSAVRTLVVTTLLGRSGIQSTSGAVALDDLPGEYGEGEVVHAVTSLLGGVVDRFAAEFAGRSAITAPAVLAGLGATLHRAVPWAAEGGPVEGEAVIEGLSDVRWERSARFWGGIAATERSDGKVTWGGGAKDSGYKVFEALTRPDSGAGRKIRGLEPEL